VTFGYDALDRMTTQVEQKSATDTITTTFGYDASGFRTRYTDGRGNSTFSTANSLGLPENVIEPATAAHPSAGDRTWTVAYDLNGNAARLTAPGGVNRTRTYDAANRMIAEAGSGTAATADRGLTYDLENRVTVVTSGGANASSYDYDDRGDLLKATGPAGNATYAYDDDAHLTTRTDAVGTATFGYKQGRTDTMKDAATGVTQKLGYTTAGTVQSIDYGAGRVRTYGYDDLGRLTSDVLRNGGNAEVAKVNYRYDLADRLTGKDTFGTAGAGTNTYDYDDAGRMTAWTSSAGKVDYAWDDSGNRIKAGAKTATYDQRNRLLSDSDYTYAYTPRGTMASRTSSGLTESYSFDAFDRLVNAEGESYVYDGLNRVINRNGKLFQYAGFEQDPVNDGTESYARGPAGELLAVEDGADNTRITVSDQHDDVVGAFDPNGTLTALSGSTAYDPYGQKTATTGTQSNVGFQGDWTDPDTGQVNMGARWYEPGTGTFTSRDTVNYSQGDSILANKYTYGAGDPMSNNDPTGNWPSCGWCKKAASAVSTAWHATTSAVSTAWHATVSAGSWLYNQAKAGLSAIYRAGVSLVKSAGRMLGRAASALRSGYNRYLKPGLSQMRNYAAQKAAAIHAAAVRVTAKATAAIQTAVKHVPLKRIGAAVMSQLSAMKLAVSAALPAKLVQTFNAVVQDMNSAAKDLYKSATAIGGSLVGGLQQAGDWIVDHKAQIIGGIAGAVVGLGCGLAIGVTGVGAVACAAAGGAIGSLVTDLVEGGKGWKEMAADALLGGTIGAVMGPLSSVGGSAVTGAFRGLVSGGLKEAAIMGRSAATSSLRSLGSTQIGGLVGRATAGRAAGSAGREAVESTGASFRSSLRADADAGGICGGTRNSFAPGTSVLMADGTSKKIEDVKVGDKVLATDPTTGMTKAKAVTQLIIGIGEKQMVKLTVDIDGAKGTKTATITATKGHPFWAPDLNRWVTADDLKPGSMLRTGAGTYVKIAATRSWTALAQQVRNLTVDGIHTYYVLAGKTAVLVHNKATCGTAEVFLDPDEGATGHASVRISGHVDGEPFDLHTELVGLRESSVQRFSGELGPNTRVLDITLHDPEMARDFVTRRLGNPGAGRYNMNTNNCVTYVACVLRAGGHYGMPKEAGPAMTSIWNTVNGESRSLGG
jgi:RHS repeat-associated protein